MEKKQKLNVKLLRKIKKHILAEPRRINMNTWGRDSQEGEMEPACKTVGCIAGWAVFLSTPKKRWDKFKADVSSIEYDAMELLGIKMEEAFALFNPYVNGEAGTREHAEAVAQRIDNFIAKAKK